jgi:hypothetical protein
MAKKNHEQLEALLRRYREVLDQFRNFARTLNDVDEPGEDWQNRLGWAWHELDQFAEHMGPDFLDIVRSYWQPAPPYGSLN